MAAKPHDMIIVAAALLIVLIGFVCGYGARARISRSRRDGYRRRHPERYGF
jgi:hypothetical protein